MRNLVPIKVKILRKPAPRGAVNDYPNFNRIDVSIRKNMDWSAYVDLHGTGWMYSKEGFGQGTDSQSQYSGLLVPADFAREALALFPDRVTEMTEAEWQAFYEDDVMQDSPTENLDTETLQGILARVQLEEKGIAPAPSVELLAARAEALDPDNPRRGINKNRRKKWADVKADRRIQIVASR